MPRRKRPARPPAEMEDAPKEVREQWIADRRRHGEVETYGKTIRVTDGLELEKLRNAGRRDKNRGISEPQFRAGLRLHDDFEMAGLNPLQGIDLARRMTVPKCRELMTGDEKLTRRLVAQLSYQAAIRYLNHSQRDLVFDICCLDLSPREAMPGLPKHLQAFTTYKLRDALEDLARFYADMDELRRRYEPQDDAQLWDAMLAELRDKHGKW